MEIQPDLVEDDDFVENVRRIVEHYPAIVKANDSFFLRRAEQILSDSARGIKQLGRGRMKIILRSVSCYSILLEEGRKECLHDKLRESG